MEASKHWTPIYGGNSIDPRGSFDGSRKGDKGHIIMIIACGLFKEGNLCPHGKKTLPIESFKLAAFLQ